MVGMKVTFCLLAYAAAALVVGGTLTESDLTQSEFYTAKPIVSYLFIKIKAGGRFKLFFRARVHAFLSAQVFRRFALVC